MLLAAAAAVLICLPYAAVGHGFLVEPPLRNFLATGEWPGPLVTTKPTDTSLLPAPFCCHGPNGMASPSCTRLAARGCTAKAPPPCPHPACVQGRLGGTR